MQRTKLSGEARPRPRICNAIRGWLADPRVNGEMIAVLVALADHVDEVGICWPSQGRIAGRLGWSRQRVGRVVGLLVESDLVRTRQLRRSDMGRSVLEYEVLGLTATPSIPASASGQGYDTKRDSRSSDQNEELSLGANHPPTRATIDDAWQPSAAAVARAQRDRPDIEVSAVLAKFRAYHHGRSVLHPDRSFILWIHRERASSHASAPEAHAQRGHKPPRPARDPGNDVDHALLRFRLRRGRALE